MVTHHTSTVLPIKQQRGGSSIGVVGNSQLSPLSITAEIEQLDAIANSASSTTSLTAGASSSANNSSNSIPSRATLRSSGRKVRQPASYAEPSTKSKLRRGDVLFPKVDPVMLPNNNSNNKGGLAMNGGGDGGAVGRTTMTTQTLSTRLESSTTDLDRIMGQIASTSSSTSSSPEAK